MLGSPGMLVSHLPASFPGVSQLCLGCRRLGARTPARAAAVFPALLFRFFLAPSAKGSDWERGSHSSAGVIGIRIPFALGSSGDHIPWSVPVVLMLWV